MKNWVLGGLILFVTGCVQQPYGKEYIYTPKDDRLSLQSKVDMLRESSAVNDDAMLSAISLLYAQNNNWIEAKGAISKAIKLNPINSTYHLYLAKYNAELANNIEAYEEAKVAFELGSYDKKLESLLARMALETSDTVNRKEFVTKFYQSNKKSREAQVLMAKLYLMEQKYNTANTMVEKVLIADSLNIEAIEIAYKSYSNLDSLEPALYYGEKLLEIDSTNAQYYFELAILYLGADNPLRAANYFAKSYQYQPLLSSLYLALGNYNKFHLHDSVIFYSDSIFSGINSGDKNILHIRAKALDKSYKYDQSFAVYNRLTKIDSTDSLVSAEKEIVLRKIAYLHRKKREQEQLADSLANAMPIIKF